MSYGISDGRLLATGQVWGWRDDRRRQERLRLRVPTTPLPARAEEIAGRSRQ